MQHETASRHDLPPCAGNLICPVKADFRPSLRNAEYCTPSSLQSASGLFASVQLECNLRHVVGIHVYRHPQRGGRRTLPDDPTPGADDGRDRRRAQQHNPTVSARCEWARMAVRSMIPLSRSLVESEGKAHVSNTLFAALAAADRARYPQRAAELASGN